MRVASLFLLVGLAACDLDLTNPIDPDSPSELSYQLIPSGDPFAPSGVLLTWEPPASGRAVSFDVFGRNGGSQWGLRATTTSPTFHDAGYPQDEYYVRALDQSGNELGRTDAIRIDAGNRLPAPAGLRSTTLNGAIQLMWSRNVIDAGANRFDYYRVYSGTFDVGRGTCVAPWYLEGTTVSDAFLVGGLTNGRTICFAVSAVSRDGHESQWSAPLSDTPRWDARAVVLHASAVRPDSSAFLFLESGTRRIGVVGPGNRADADLLLERRVDGSLWITPARSGVGLIVASAATTELSAIERAPVSGYSTAPVEARAGQVLFARVVIGGAVHYGALRTVHVGRETIVFDFAFQTAADTPDLSRR